MTLYLFCIETDELSGFYLFVANNCSQDWEKVTPVYRHQGPVLGSSRVAVTFPANAPEIGQCVRIYVNRTSAILPAGYSPRAKLDICNWKILGKKLFQDSLFVGFLKKKNSYIFFARRIGIRRFPVTTGLLPFAGALP